MKKPEKIKLKRRRVEIRWEKYEKTYSNGIYGKVGKWAVFHIFYETLTSDHHPVPYRLLSKLPGIKADLGRFKLENEAKEQGQKVFVYWLKLAGLYPKEIINNDTSNQIKIEKENKDCSS